MWWNILPSLGIMTGITLLQFKVLWPGCTWIDTGGNKYRRSLDYEHRAHAAARDMYITGNLYRHQGIEAIPDAE